MDILLNTICGVKNFNKLETVEVVSPSSNCNREQKQNWFFINWLNKITMKFRKDQPMFPSKEHGKVEILKLNKNNCANFKSPSSSSKPNFPWLKQISKRNSTCSLSENLFPDFQNLTVDGEKALPVNIYAEEMSQVEHYNFVGEDKFLGLIVLSIKYPTKSTNEDSKKRTLLLLRSESGLICQKWNQFQISDPYKKSVPSLISLSFPQLSLLTLLPIICPEGSALIKEFDEKQLHTMENSNRTRHQSIDAIKELQENLIKHTCHFLEPTERDLNRYTELFLKKPNRAQKSFNFGISSFRTPKKFNQTKSLLRSPINIIESAETNKVILVMIVIF